MFPARTVQLGMAMTVKEMGAAVATRRAGGDFKVDDLMGSLLCGGGKGLEMTKIPDRARLLAALPQDGKFGEIARSYNVHSSTISRLAL